MKNYFLSLALILSLGAFEGKAQQRSTENAIDLVRAVYPKAARIVSINGYWQKAVDGKGQLLGFVFDSEPYGHDIVGFAKDTPLLIITDKKHKVQKMVLYHHLETPAYVKKMIQARFFEQVNGKTIFSLAEAHLDAVAGATFTSEAVTKTLQRVGQRAIEKRP